MTGHPVLCTAEGAATIRAMAMFLFDFMESSRPSGKQSGPREGSTGRQITGGDGDKWAEYLGSGPIDLAVAA